MGRLARGMEWEWFLLVFLVIPICLIMYDINNPRPIQYVPNEVARLAPTGPIAELMKEIENEGYLVYHTKDLQQDEKNHNRLLIEYVVMTQDKSKDWRYRWAWEVPVVLTIPELAKEAGIYNRALDECRLIPLSKPAKDVHHRLAEYGLKLDEPDEQTSRQHE